MSLSAQLDAIQAGDRVRFVVHLINEGERSITVPQGQQDTVAVSVRRNGAELWRWQAAIKRDAKGGTVIPPSDRVRWFCEWPDPSYGTYTAVSTVTLEDTTLEADSPVTVTKRVAEAAAAGPAERGDRRPDERRTATGRTEHGSQPADRPPSEPDES